MPNQKRNPQPRGINGYFLNLPYLSRSFEVEKPTDLTCLDPSGDIAALSLTGYDGSCYREIELSDFFLQCHL